MKPTTPPATVSRPVLAWVEQILEARNVDGKVPGDVFFRILDDMGDITDRTAGWSCAAMRRYGIHAACKACLPKETL